MPPTTHMLLNYITKNVATLQSHDFKSSIQTSTRRYKITELLFFSILIFSQALLYSEINYKKISHGINLKMYAEMLDNYYQKKIRGNNLAHNLN